MVIVLNRLPTELCGYHGYCTEPVGHSCVVTMVTVLNQLATDLCGYHGYCTEQVAHRALCVCIYAVCVCIYAGRHNLSKLTHHFTLAGSFKSACGFKLKS